MMKRAILLAVISLALNLAAIAGFAQVNAAPSGKAEAYQEIVASFKRLHEKAAIPKTHHALQINFKTADYFSILKNISLEETWQLGFIYCRDENGASPILTAYRSEEEYKTLGAKITKGYRSSKIYGNEEYWPHVKLNGTEDGYFEYVVLSILGSQFSLDSRANYNDIEIVCTKPAIQEIVKVTKPDERLIREAQLVDPTPSVTIDAKQAIVRIVIFTKWGGFIERKYHISPQFPYKIKKIKAKALAKFKCGVVL